MLCVCISNGMQISFDLNDILCFNTKTMSYKENKHERSESKAYERKERKSGMESEYKKGVKKSGKNYKGKSC
jgi:hypothetical protein